MISLGFDALHGASFSFISHKEFYDFSLRTRDGAPFQTYLILAISAMQVSALPFVLGLIDSSSSLRIPIFIMSYHLENMSGEGQGGYKAG